jgi:VanZ family protein
VDRRADDSRSNGAGCGRPILTAQLSAGRVAWLWLPVLVWAGIIFALSATPNLRFAQAADLDFVVRKAGHMAAFGILAVLLWRALAFSAVRRAIVWSWVLTVAYATTDELHQSFTAGRHPSPVDVGIDSAGALLFLLALTLWLRSRRTHGGITSPDQD